MPDALGCRLAYASLTGGSLMRWLRGLFGVIFVALGALWTLQGLNVLQGTFMSGQTMFAAIGLVLLLIGLWLLWSLRRTGGKVSVG
jgi:hypothetical protein